ncbi:MAG TPA: hypothetical protein VHF87_03455 [Methylomirabilota bacterium]|nr:hypothetical protein [Methylomirabilota bacterium]
MGLPWACSRAAGCDTRASGRRRSTSVHTASEHECRAKSHSLDTSNGAFRGLSYQAEYLWIKHVISRYERVAYTESDLVLVNYDSVRRIFLEQYGRGAEARTVPYAAELAFLREGGRQPPEPEHIAALQPRSGR